MKGAGSPPSENSRLNEIIADYLAAVDAGQAPDRAGLLAAHPDLAGELQAFFADADHIDRLAPPNETVAFHEAPPAEAPTLAPGEESVGSRPSLALVRYIGDYE